MIKLINMEQIVTLLSKQVKAIYHGSTQDFQLEGCSLKSIRSPFSSNIKRDKSVIRKLPYDGYLCLMDNF